MLTGDDIDILHSTSVSKEEDLEENHTIVPDGYNIGRDLLVASAVNGGGITSHNGVIYKATSQNITGLLTPGADGVNHGEQLLVQDLWLVLSMVSP
jgi:hypothetical protein